MYQPVLPPAVLGGTIVAAGPSDAANAAGRVAGAMLPVTGVAIGGLLLAALVLIVLGVSLRLASRRQLPTA